MKQFRIFKLKIIEFKTKNKGVQYETFAFSINKK